jgi:hypothetical protein
MVFTIPPVVVTVVMAIVAHIKPIMTAVCYSLFRAGPEFLQKTALTEKKTGLRDHAEEERCLFCWAAHNQSSALRGSVGGRGRMDMHAGIGRRVRSHD